MSRQSFIALYTLPLYAFEPDSFATYRIRWHDIFCITVTYNYTFISSDINSLNSQFKDIRTGLSHSYNSTFYDCRKEV